jgi:hypothetical protein
VSAASVEAGAEEVEVVAVEEEEEEEVDQAGKGLCKRCVVV